MRLIAGNAGKLVHSLIARAPFKPIADLKGATVGILNMKEGTFFQIKTMLATHGLNFPADYKVTETGGVPPRHKALLDGAIDAGLQSVPWNYVAEDAGMNNLGNVIDYVPDWQFVSINANSEWAAANRDLLVRFLRTLLAPPHGSMPTARPHPRLPRARCRHRSVTRSGRGTISPGPMR